MVRWRAGPIPTTLLENLVVLTAALYALTVFRHRAPLPRRTPLDLPIALLLLAGIVGTLVASDHRGALGIFRAYLVEPIAIYYIAVAVFALDESIDLLLEVMGAGAVLFGLLQLVAFVRALHEGRLDPDFAPGAFNINANSVSLYLDPLIGLATGLALFGQGRRRWGALAVLVVVLAADLSTLSRGGLLAIAVLLLIAIGTTQTWRVQLAWVVAAGLAAFLIFKLPIIGPRVSRTFDPAWGTFAGRGRIWAATLRMLRDHPLFGAGLNSYESTMGPYRAADAAHLIPEPYPHNIFLTSWTELGLIGLAAFTFILLSLVIRPLRAFRRASGFPRALIWGLGSAFAMILTHGLVDSPYWKNDLSVEFWILAALEIVSLSAAARGGREERRLA